MSDTNEKTHLISRNRSWSELVKTKDKTVCYKERRAPQIVASFVVYLGSLSLGIALGFSSPSIPDLQLKFHANSTQTSWFGSLVTLGGAVGAVIAGFSIDRMGRKSTLMVGNLPLVVGYAIIAGVKTMTWLYVGRILTGLGMGMMAVSVNVYIAETTTVNLRGALGTGTQIGAAFGIFLIYLLGIPLEYQWLAVCGACVATLMAFLVLVIPETPRWFIQNGKNRDATKALHWLRGKDANIDDEFKEIERNIASQPEKFHISDIRLSRYFKPLILAVILHIFQKFVGVNAIEFYTESIFKDAGFEENANVPPVIVSLMSIFGAIPSIILVDKLGRKAMLVCSGILTGVSTLALGLFYYLYEEKHYTNLSWLPILCLLVFNFGFAMGWGPVSWLLASELLPLKIRGLGSGLASVVNWMMGFLVSKEFPALVEATSNYVGFWIFAGMSVLSIVFVICLLRKTKGKSLEDIEEYFIPSCNKET